MAARFWPIAAPTAASACPPDPFFVRLPLKGAAQDVVKVSRLEKRADFLRLAKGRKCVTEGLVLQMQAAPDGEQGLRVGFTATKKLGSAVVRNRTKRRLREVARQILPLLAKPGFDYVLIGREATATRLFAHLVDDLKLALSRVHASRPKKAEKE